MMLDNHVGSLGRITTAAAFTRWMITWPRPSRGDTHIVACIKRTNDPTGRFVLTTYRTLCDKVRLVREGQLQLLPVRCGFNNVVVLGLFYVFPGCWRSTRVRSTTRVCFVFWYRKQRGEHCGAIGL